MVVEFEANVGVDEVDVDGKGLMGGIRYYGRGSEEDG